MKVSYKNGGIFCLKRVKSTLNQGVTYFDYEILIESIDDSERLEQLHRLHKQSTQVYT